MTDIAAATPNIVLQAAIRSAGYEDKPQAISDVHIQVEAGQLIGLIGPNGAGKSTTIKCMLGLLPHWDGSIELGGAKQRWAYVPEQPLYYDYLTLWEHLQLAASAFNMPEEQFIPKAEALLERFRLTEERNHYPSSFSKGMQQKLMLIIAFMLEPELFIVDEPFVGLDPRATQDFIALLNEARAAGAGVLMSTHMLDTAERLCDSFILINNGTVVAHGSIADIRKQADCGEQAALFDCFSALT